MWCSDLAPSPPPLSLSLSLALWAMLSCFCYIIVSPSLFLSFLCVFLSVLDTKPPSNPLNNEPKELSVKSLEELQKESKPKPPALKP